MNSNVLRTLPLLLWPGALLLLFGAVPLALLLRVSLAPHDPSGLWNPGITPTSYVALTDQELVRAVGYSLGLAAAVAAISVGLGFPLTYLITRMPRPQQVGWLIFLLATLSLSDVLTAFSWQVILSKRIGLSNLLVWIGLMDHPDSLTPSNGAVLVCLVYLVLPFTVLTLYPSLSRLDRALVEAARTLGDSPLRSFISVVIPIARGPTFIAFLMSAVLTLGAYVPPLVLGRPEYWTMAVLIGQTALGGHNLSLAAAMSIFLLAVTVSVAITTARAANPKTSR
jgi:putative spermidine/putrescine transport system permease protein